MSYIMVDIEADGPVPGIYSMIEIGAVIVEPSLEKRFYGTLKPISDNWIPEALAVTNRTREETLKFDNPLETMIKFDDWVRKTSKHTPQFVSDNNLFDGMFVFYYLWKFVGSCVFGYSSHSLGSLFKGFNKNMNMNLKRFKSSINTQKHDHNPVHDALGNAQAMLEMAKIYQIKGLNFS